MDINYDAVKKVVKKQIVQGIIFYFDREFANLLSEQIHSVTMNSFMTVGRFLISILIIVVDYSHYHISIYSNMRR